MEKPNKEIYSLHRFVDENGIPNRDKIMSEKYPLKETRQGELVY